jgi:hypothetical protein
MIKDMKTINLLNYNENVVVVSTKHDSYAIEPAINSETPTILPLNLEEILYINGNSAAFKSGILRFPEDIEKEMYEDHLRIPNWKDMLTIKEMEDIILRPTMEKLVKLVGIKDVGIFDRLRGVFTRLKNTTNSDISMRVERIINARSDELRRGIRNTEIVIKPKDTVSVIQNEEVDALKKQNIALQEQMTQMRELMEKMLASQSSNTDSVSDGDNEAKEEPVKKPGRPKKN